MNVIFLSTPDCGCPYLSAIEAAGGEIVAVITQPDRRRGRGRTLAAPPVKTAALAHGLRVLQPPTCRDEGVWEQLQALRPDIILVVAFGQILCPGFLAQPQVAALNVHYSLLPRLRGAAPVQYALLQGLTETGASLQHLAVELDAGDIVAQATLPIEPYDDAGTLTLRLTDVGCDLVRELLPRVMAGTAPRAPQDEALASWAPRLSKQDGALDWTEPAPAVVNRVRATNPWPGAYCYRGDQRLGVLRARYVEAGAAGSGPGAIVTISAGSGPIVATGEGAVELLVVQPQGRKAMTGAEYLRGARLAPGDLLLPGR